MTRQSKFILRLVYNQIIKTWIYCVAVEIKLSLRFVFFLILQIPHQPDQPSTEPVMDVLCIKQSDLIGEPVADLGGGGTPGPCPPPPPFWDFFLQLPPFLYMCPPPLLKAKKKHKCFHCGAALRNFIRNTMHLNAFQNSFAFISSTEACFWLKRVQIALFSAFEKQVSNPLIKTALRLSSAKITLKVVLKTSTPGAKRPWYLCERPWYWVEKSPGDWDM